MAQKVFSVDTMPGIQRDGTVYDKTVYNDGEWVRFQRGRPRKMGGYRVISGNLNGPSRGIWVNPQNSLTTIFSGYNNGLQSLVIDDNGIGVNANDFTLSNFTQSNLNLWQFDGFYDVTGAGVQAIVAHPGQNLAAIDSTVDTPVLSGDINGLTMSQIGVFQEANAFLVNSSTSVTLKQANSLIGAGQTVTGTDIPASTTVVSKVDASDILAGVSITGVAGTLSCTATSGLFVGQSVTVSGVQGSQALASVAITGTGGTFSCTATTGLYVDQPVYVTGTQAGTALAAVAVTGTAGQCSCTAVNGLFIGQAVVVSGTLSGTATGIVSGFTYYIIATDGTSTFTLSATPGGTALTTTAGTTTGLTFTVRLFTGVTSGVTYFITATNGTSTFTLSNEIGGASISTAANSLSGLTFSVPKATGLASGTTYYIIATNFTTTFTLSTTINGSAITTIVNATTGLVFTLGLYTKVVISNAATGTGQRTLTFNNNISVSGGLVSLHPYLFVYGNNGLIQNCSAGNTNDWVSADANATNVATGKVVQGLPVRGGSNAPSGLFWSLDSLIRVSFIGGTGTPPQFWRYDIISSQSSILSSQSAIEYDGIYYWCGVDRFLLYNGVVKEIPNTMNQNYFFDNLNYAQRQKVWVTKVPRFGEIWWFYPRGDATECTDAIIYNVRENVWYDAGEALGARRSAGYFSQVFAFPVAADWDASEAVVVFTQSMTPVSGSALIFLNAYNAQVQVGQVISGTGIPTNTQVTAITTSNIDTLGAITPGSGYVNNTYTNVPLTLGAGENATATVVVSGGVVTSVTITNRGAGYQVGDSLSALNTNLGGSGSGFAVAVSAIYPQAILMSANATVTGPNDLTFSTQAGLVRIFQNEIGTDAVDGQNVLAIRSYFETSDLSLTAGGPSQTAVEGLNRWLRIERIEPDFLQQGEMSVVVTGRPFAQGEDKESDPYVFGPNIGKIDMREQRRELRLRFISDVAGGDYQLGRLLLNAEIGDVRPYGP
jgi:hypothetical protein